MKSLVLPIFAVLLMVGLYATFNASADSSPAKAKAAAVQLVDQGASQTVDTSPQAAPAPQAVTAPQTATMSSCGGGGSCNPATCGCSPSQCSGGCGGSCGRR